MTLQEACQATGLEPHVLRYWESEFSQLRPRKNSSGVRIYREKDLELVRRLKVLLHDEQLTVQAARKKLSSERQKPVTEEADPCQLLMPFMVEFEPPANAPRDGAGVSTDKTVEMLREILQILEVPRKGRKK